MRLDRLEVAGFGALVDCDVHFGTGLSVVTGPNEAGKSTLTAVLLALLYGPVRGDKEAWRPWSGGRYAATLHYTLADGRAFEIRRDFERDAKGVRVYDAHGNEASRECAVGKSIVPGHAHLGIPLEVFVNASFVAQGDVAIDGSRADRIAHALARALDGGPKEDAALGALRRLDDALATHVGKKRATIHAPVRNLTAALAEAQARAGAMRASLQALGALRARVTSEAERANALAAAVRALERRVRAQRAFDLRSHLAALRELRDDLAALQAERARYDDVAHFDAAGVPAYEASYHAWRTACELAAARAADAAHAAERLRDAPLQRGAVDVDDAAFDAIEGAARAARDATSGAASAEGAARAAGCEPPSARMAGLGRVPLVAGIVAAFSAVGFEAAHDVAPALGGAFVALVCFFLTLLRASERRTERRAAAVAAERARAAERRANEAEAELARLLSAYGAASFEEVARNEHAMRERAALNAEAERYAERARAAVDDAAAAGRRVDAAGARLWPERFAFPQTQSARADLYAAIKRCELRKRSREGLDLRLSMLAVRRSDLLGDTAEHALEAELRELTAAGVEAASDGPPARELDAELRALERRSSDARAAAAAAGAELRAAEAHVGDLAALDENVLLLRDRLERLERFEAAVTLARTTIETRTHERHRRFAYRLTEYASRTLAHVTGERYPEIRVDPVTLALRVRVPQSGDFVGVERLSAGTREQAYLMVRLAMARMLSEGLETAPVLLDDPFAYWDDARIARGLPLLLATARDAQVIVFSTSGALAREAAGHGARVIELGAPGAAALARRPAM